MVSGPRPYLYLTCGSRLCLRCSFSPILKDAPEFSHTASFPAQRARVHSVPRIVTPQPTVARLIKAATLAAPSGPSSAPVLCELAPAPSTLQLHLSKFLPEFLFLLFVLENSLALLSPLSPGGSVFPPSPCFLCLYCHPGLAFLVLFFLMCTFGTGQMVKSACCWHSTDICSYSSRGSYAFSQLEDLCPHTYLF